MYAESLCGFCQKLPVASPKKPGRESRCPLCKAQLVTADQGTIYRVVADADRATGTFVKSFLQKLGVG